MGSIPKVKEPTLQPLADFLINSKEYEEPVKRDKVPPYKNCKMSLPAPWLALALAISTPT